VGEFGKNLSDKIFETSNSKGKYVVGTCYMLNRVCQNTNGVFKRLVATGYLNVLKYSDLLEHILTLASNDA